MTTKQRLPQLTLENVTLMFPNFAGEGRPPYNAAGDRNFCVLVDDELAKHLKADGWNVRTLKTTDPDVAPGQIISVTVKTDSKFPPRLWLIHGNNRPQLMDPDDFRILDYAKFRSVSVRINPYIWQEKPQRVSGFLEEGYFQLEPDPLRERYFAADGNP